MVDKKTAAIFALIVLVVITGEGWYVAWSKTPSVTPLPEGVENRTEYFQGYEAYLDDNIHIAVYSGPSMNPTFKDNDLILWVEVNPAELKVGDIIIYEDPTNPYHKLVAHRIIETRIEEEVYGFRTKGDNNPDPDHYWVDNILGLVIGVVYSKAS